MLPTYYKIKTSGSSKIKCNFPSPPPVSFSRRVRSKTKYTLILKLMQFELMFSFSKSSNYISSTGSTVFILKVLMVTHVLHFLPRHHIQEEQFFYFFKYKFWWKVRAHRISFKFFQKEFFGYRNTFSLYFSWIGAQWCIKLFLNL